MRFRDFPGRCLPEWESFVSGTLVLRQVDTKRGSRSAKQRVLFGRERISQGFHRQGIK